MDLKVTSRSLGRVFAAMGFLLASLGVTAPAGAVSLVFQYGNSLKTHAHYEAIKERVELLARAYNNGFAGDTIIPIVLENCTGGCYGQSVTNRSARPYQELRNALAEQVCGTVAGADAGCPNPMAHATARDIETFRSGMWPSGLNNPITHSPYLMVMDANYRELGLLPEIRRVSSGQEYWTMCSHENSSWCTKPDGEFHLAAYDIQHPDSTISINIDALHDFGGYGGLLVDVLDHELAEAMGLGSGCENDGSGCDYFPWVQDMFRYKSNHEHPTTERTYSVSEKYWVYFSTDNGHSPLLGTGHGPYFNTNLGTHVPYACHVGSFPNCSTSPVVNGHSVTCTECSYQNCVEGDYGDWYSCPGETFTSRDQNAFEYGDPTMGGLGWTALELQGYTLKNPSLHEGYKARPASGRAVSAARSQLAVSHFQSRVKRADARCRLGQAARALRNPSAGDSARCDRQFTRRVRSLSQSVGEFPGYGDLGYHVDNNNHWVQTVQDFVGAAHESANSACARKLLRLVSRHLGCEGKAQSAELRGRNNWGSRIRLRCDQRLEKGLNSLVEKYPEPVSCAAHFEASEVIEASRSDFRGETVRVGD